MLCLKLIKNEQNLTESYNKVKTRENSTGMGIEIIMG